MYENIVFEGCSSKLYAYIGVITELEKQNILQNIKNFVGTSSGSIIALMLALNYNPTQIKEIIFDIDPNNYGAKTNMFKGIYNLIKYYGYINPEKYIEFIKNVIKVKTNNENTTFKQLYEMTQNVLVITGTCINKRETHYYNYISNPNMELFKAIQISTCLPYALPVVKWNEDILLDGGLLENFPIFYINEDGTFPNSRKEIVKFCEKTHVYNKKTLGVKILSEKYKNNQEYYIGNDTNIKNLFDLTKNIYNTLNTQIEKNSIKKGYWDNTITIKIPDTFNNYTFKLTQQQKDFLFIQGQLSVNDFFTQK